MNPWDAACAPADTSLSPQRSPVCFPDQVHRKADAARFYIKAAGVIVLRDRRYQPSLGKHRPIRSPDCQIYRIRDMKKPGAISSQTEPAQSPYISPMSTGITPPLCLQLLRSPPAGTRAALLISCSSSMSRRNTSTTAEKQYMPRSKSLYARPVMRSRSAISSCVSPLRLRSALTYPEKKP